MQISITVEAQEGLTWSRWKKFVTEVENLGYAGLYRSDHFPTDKAALELIVSLAYLADNTQRIHFGSLVAAVGRHHPDFPAAGAVGEEGQVSAIGGPGRSSAVVLGVGQDRRFG